MAFQRRLSKETYVAVKDMLSAGEGMAEIGRELMISRTTIGWIKKSHSYEDYFTLVAESRRKYGRTRGKYKLQASRTSFAEKVEAEAKEYVWDTYNFDTSSLPTLRGFLGWLKK